MIVKNVAKVIVLNESSEVLLLRRSKTDPRRAGEWDFPGGGIEDDEDTTDGVIREAAEEAGLSLSHNDVTLIYTATEYHEQHDESVNRFLFIARITTAQAARVRLSYEHDQAVWRTTDQALVDFPHPFYATGLQYAVDHGLI